MAMNHFRRECTRQPDAASYFDTAAANWDAEPRRVELTKVVGQRILESAQPTRDMDVLDYGCGTGLLGLFLLPHVNSVTGADSSSGMLEVLDDKIHSGGLQRMRALRLDLQLDAPPDVRYHMIVANMVLHHVERPELLLTAFHRMLHPGGSVAIADLDAEPGLFHNPDVAANVPHHGFDRNLLAEQLCQAGFANPKSQTAHVIAKPVADGSMRDFPVFLLVARRPQ